MSRRPDDAIHVTIHCQRYHLWRDEAERLLVELTASPWARKRFRCDYRSGCDRPVRHIRVQVGEPQHGYCYSHYLEAKSQDTPTGSEER